jgi:iron complex transport system ATP-binding protein
MTLEAHGVEVRAGGHRLLDDASVAVHPGQLVAVLGPNGAGKSTLLRTLAGDLAPTRGDVRMDGRPLVRWSAAERARRRAVLSQQVTLAFPFTALEVVLLGRTPHVQGSERAADVEIARDALEVTGTRHLESRLYPTLSGGEQQRVQLARALAQVWTCPPDGARYLLLDEPTASLDLAHQHVAIETLKTFARAGTGVLVVVHDLNLAVHHADHVVLLRGGHVLAAGPPDAVLTVPRLREAFGVPVLALHDPRHPRPFLVLEPTARWENAGASWSGPAREPAPRCAEIAPANRPDQTGSSRGW